MPNFFSHLLPKLRTYFYVRLIDGVARIFPTYYAASSIWTRIRLVAPLLRDLNPGHFTNWATAAAAGWPNLNADNEIREVYPWLADSLGAQDDGGTLGSWHRLGMIFCQPQSFSFQKNENLSNPLTQKYFYALFSPFKICAKHIKIKSSILVV